MGEAMADDNGTIAHYGKTKINYEYASWEVFVNCVTVKLMGSGHIEWTGEEHPLIIGNKMFPRFQPYSRRHGDHQYDMRGVASCIQIIPEHIDIQELIQWETACQKDSETELPYSDWLEENQWLEYADWLRSR